MIGTITAGRGGLRLLPFPVCILIFLCWSGICGAAPPQRIVSLAPSITEVICALGLERNLVGVTTFCDYPPSVRGKATVGGPANPSMEAILALKPDLVVLDEEGLGPRLTNRLEALGVKTTLFHGSRLAGLAEGIRALARELGVPQRGEQLAAVIEHSLKRIKTEKKTPRVLFIIWPDPLITAGRGTVIDDALRIAGMKNIAASSRGTYPRLSLEVIMARDPELIIVGQGHTLGPPLEKLLKRLASLDAVRKRHICYVDDALYRSGPRVPEGIRELRRCAERFTTGAAKRGKEKPLH